MVSENNGNNENLVTSSNNRTSSTAYTLTGDKLEELEENQTISVSNTKYKVETEFSNDEENLIEALLKMFMNEQNLKYKE